MTPGPGSADTPSPASAPSAPSASAPPASAPAPSVPASAPAPYRSSLHGPPVAAPGPVLDLSMNEGRLPPEECIETLRRAGTGILREYGDPRPLEEAYADYLGVGPECVLATTGADDAIDRVCRAWLGPDRRMVFLTPTFYMIPAYARMTRGRLAPLEYEWGTLPSDRLLEAVDETTGLVAVVSPDNPTGREFPASALLDLAARLPEGVPLMVDSAYAEFGDEANDPALLRRPNVLTIRTMSKCWSLAGIRTGFVVGAEDRIAELRGYGGPYPVSGPALVLALDALRNGRERMRSFVASVRSGRERLAELVRETGGDPQPSSTNFVLARFDDAQWVFRGLRAQGVLVRRIDGLADHVRITVPRTEAEFDRLEAGLRATRRPDAVLFDMDGVLADVSRSCRAAIAAACASLGVSASPEEIDAAKARGGANDDWALTHQLATDAGVSTTLAEATARFEEAYQGTATEPGLRRHETLIPSRAFLAGLASCFKLGVVTGRPRRDARRFLDEYGIAHLFGAVVCREDAPLKPDPEPVRVALERLGARSAWLLGDTPDDVRAAQAAGVVPVGVAAPGAGRRMREALAAAGAARIVEAGPNFGGLLDE